MSKAERDASANDPRLLDADRRRGLCAVLKAEVLARVRNLAHPWLHRDFKDALKRYGFSLPWSSVGDCPGWALEGHAEDPVTASEAGREPPG